MPPRAPRRGRTTPAADMPPFVEPMLATMAKAPFDGDPGWLFEIKWDGFRALCRMGATDKQCRLAGRHRTDFSGRFPKLVKALSGLPAGVMLDGEIVALRPDGTADFGALLRRNPAGPTALAYVAFDLLYAEGVSVMTLPCGERRDSLGRSSGACRAGRS